MGSIGPGTPKMTTVDLLLLRDTFVSAIHEDVGPGDLTSRSTIPENHGGVARIVAKQALVVAGLPVAAEVMRLVDPDAAFSALAEDQTAVTPGTVLAEIRGSARSLLTAERTMLNFLQRMSGIATLARQYVDRIQGTRARIVDTRKTAPGLRVLDKYAVACGGAMNHRGGLFDGVLIKNNHRAFHSSPAQAIRSARIHLGHLVKIEIEIHRLDELSDAIEAGADVALLDNFTPEQTRRAVEVAAGRVPLESSGGITLDNVRDYAEAGVDYISIGALTHSVKAVDIHMRIVPE
jgi:nicotinate-nucleotide pyrophosphorylase (carboxylating)